MDETWLDIDPYIEYDLKDSVHFQRLLRNEYCKDIRDGVFYESIQTMQKAAVPD
jgi:hypothetical protein